MKNSNGTQDLFRISPAISSDETKKQSYFSALFSKSYWYPNLLNINPNVDTHQSVVQNKKTPLAVETPRAAISNTVSDLERIEQKEVNLNELEMQTPKIEKKSAEDKKIEKTKIHLDSDFNTYLKSFNPDWKIEDIVGINQVADSGIDIIFFGLEKLSKNEVEAFEIAPYSALDSSQDMLGKMITAMKLRPGSFLRCPLFDFDSPLEHLLQVVNQFKPKIIVCLGAIATNTLLEKKVRLANVHGDITQKVIELKNKDEAIKSLSFHVAPLFHPELLEINQSMKRTAWVDMQRVMKFIQDPI